MFTLKVKKDLTPQVSVVVCQELAFLFKCMAEYFKTRPDALTYGVQLGWRSLELTFNDVADSIMARHGQLPEVAIYRSGLNIGAGYTPASAPEAEAVKLAKTICKSVMFLLHELNSGSRNESIGAENLTAIRELLCQWQKEVEGEIRQLAGKSAEPPKVMKRNISGAILYGLWNV